MEFQERTTGHTVVVDLQGPVDRDDASPTVLLRRLRSLLDHGYTSILLDVAQVAYVDSVLLGAMVQAYVSAVRAGGTLKLLHATKRFRDLLAVTKLDRVLDAVDSEEAWRATLKK